jgi:hypothetical protein
MPPDNALVALMQRHAELDAMVRTDASGAALGTAGVIEDALAVSEGAADASQSIQRALGLLGLGREHSWAVSTDDRNWYAHHHEGRIILGRGPKQHNTGGALTRLFGSGRRR